MTPIAQISLLQGQPKEDHGKTWCLHRLAVASLLEDLRSHVARGTAGCGQDMELFLIHDSGETEISYQQIGVVLWSPEQQVLRFEIPMDDSMVVEVCHGGQGGSDQVCSV